MIGSITIVGVALKYGDSLVISRPKPARHPDIINSDEFQSLNLHPYIQGFITNEGEFVDRRTACIIATRNKQPLREPFRGSEAFSENFW